MKAPTSTIRVLTVEEILDCINDPILNELDAIFEKSQALRKDQWRERFGLIKKAYKLNTPRILERARYGETIDPYFIQWDFSPIEFNAWCEIRGQALPFYPQYPVEGFFVDFADPYRKIALELDGKYFHDPVKDAARDAKLLAVGWEVFRIPGAVACRYKEQELDEYLPQGAESYGDLEEYEQQDVDEYVRRTTLDGFFSWLKKHFYSPDDMKGEEHGAE